MRSGQANSKMFPKESRPPYLQDDDYFDSFKQEIALQAVMVPFHQEVYLLSPCCRKLNFKVSLMIELLMEFIGILAKV